MYSKKFGIQNVVTTYSSLILIGGRRWRQRFKPFLLISMQSELHSKSKDRLFEWKTNQFVSIAAVITSESYEMTGMNSHRIASESKLLCLCACVLYISHLQMNVCMSL